MAFIKKLTLATPIDYKGVDIVCVRISRIIVEATNKRLHVMYSMVDMNSNELYRFGKWFIDCEAFNGLTEELNDYTNATAVKLEDEDYLLNNCGHVGILEDI